MDFGKFLEVEESNRCNIDANTILGKVIIAKQSFTESS